MTKTRKSEAQSRTPSGSKPSSVPGAKTRAQFQGEFQPGEEVAYLRDEVGRLEREREKYEKEHGGLLTLFRDLKEAVIALEPPEIIYKRPKKSATSTPVVHTSQWCDWHTGAIQDAEEIEGFNDFSPEILHRRLVNCVRDQLDWLDVHRKNYTVNVSHDLFTGDLISGGIHPELLRTNAWPEPVQAINAGELVAEVLAMKAPHFERVIVDFITADNHSRLTRKPQAAEAGYNCWGYVVAHHAKARLEKFKNVEFNIHPLIQKVVKVGGRHYLLMHGDRIRGWAGFPYYGIQTKAGREAIKRMKQALDDFRRSEFNPDVALGRLYDLIIMGHWHAPLTHPVFWIGGSASGTSTYDHSEGRDAKPIQCAWYVHPKHGEFDRTNWILRDDPV